MAIFHKRIGSKKYYFNDTSFNLLMQKRIVNVLLLCSKYDAFMIEEDGRIDEQIFIEYVSLNLRYPPIFIQASTNERAFQILREKSIDLIVVMPNTGNFDVFELAKDIKLGYPNKPIVVLTPFSREVTLKLGKENLSMIDYVFCWLGNADILLAAIKLIEDRMNADFDVNEIGVQAILLVEDSIRYYSSYLPNIYKIIFKQSKAFMTEGMNEHQMTMRMRGRPKILLATNYEEAIQVYEKYKNNLLGIISDISYCRNGEMDNQAGLRLCEKVKSDDSTLTFLLQSSDSENEKIANDLGAGFLNKYSKTLSIELRDFIIQHFAFGDFIFRDPDTKAEITRAHDLQALQNKILDVPDKSLEYHIKRNHFSKW
ncbi:MAG: phosphoenolpyruvate synthase, partial [Bacteroidota bacterium]|nr:phosphoenolpyruvate synthase [Bacteroidota bacterium]